MNAHADTPAAPVEDAATRTREERARNRWLDADTIADALRQKAPGPEQTAARGLLRPPTGA